LLNKDFLCSDLGFCFLRTSFGTDNNLIFSYF
jgi:hypothetical protein